MNIILSRKGFDSSYGGVASPILPDGTLQSLPIPYRHAPHTYNDLAIGNISLGTLVADLTRGRISGSHFAHLDPDLNPATCPRLPGWKPLFGQIGASQRHLAGNGVAAGDLFLFFGWFRQTEYVQNRLCFVKGAPDLHVLFGWLQIGEVWKPDAEREPIPDWALYHPHMQAQFGRDNTVYVGSERLALGDVTLAGAGGGVFARYTPSLRLTAPGTQRSVWHLPPWFAPRGAHFPLTYHHAPGRWNPQADHTLLLSAPRGQEFVLDTSAYPEAIPWARDLISASTTAHGVG